MEKIKVTEVEHYPVCPFCDNQLSELHWHKVRGVATTQVGYVAVYSCPRCRKVLASSASRT